MSKSATSIEKTKQQVLGDLNNLNVKAQEARLMSEAIGVKESTVKTQVRDVKIKESDKMKDMGNPSKKIETPRCDENDCQIDESSKDANKVEDSTNCEDIFKSTSTPTKIISPNLECHQKSAEIFVESPSKLHLVDETMQGEDQNTTLSELGTTSDSQTNHSLTLLDEQAEEFSFPQIRMQDLEDVFGPGAENQASTDEESRNRDDVINLVEDSRNVTKKCEEINQSKRSSEEANMGKRRKRILGPGYDTIQTDVMSRNEGPSKVEGPRSKRREKQPVVIEVENSPTILDDKIDSDPNDNNYDSDSSFTANITLKDYRKGHSLRRSPRIKMQVSKPKQPVSDEIVVEYPAQEQEDEQETVFTEVTGKFDTIIVCFQN